MVGEPPALRLCPSLIIQRWRWEEGSFTPPQAENTFNHCQYPNSTASQHGLMRNFTKQSFCIMRHRPPYANRKIQSMIKLEDIQAQHMLTGIVPEQIVRIVAVEQNDEGACTKYGHQQDIKSRMARAVNAAEPRVMQ